MNIEKVAQQQKGHVRKWLEAGKLVEALEAQGKAGSGASQVATIIAAQDIVMGDLRWQYQVSNLDAAINEWTFKANRYGTGTFPLSDKQIQWAAPFLQEQFDQALAAKAIRDHAEEAVPFGVGQRVRTKWDGKTGIIIGLIGRDALLRMDEPDEDGVTEYGESLSEIEILQEPEAQDFDGGFG